MKPKPSLIRIIRIRFAMAVAIGIALTLVSVSILESNRVQKKAQDLLHDASMDVINSIIILTDDGISEMVDAVCSLILSKEEITPEDLQSAVKATDSGIILFQKSGGEMLSSDPLSPDNGFPEKSAGKKFMADLPYLQTEIFVTDDGDSLRKGESLVWGGQRFEKGLILLGMDLKHLNDQFPRVAMRSAIARRIGETGWMEMEILPEGETAQETSFAGEFAGEFVSDGQMRKGVYQEIPVYYRSFTVGIAHFLALIPTEEMERTWWHGLINSMVPICCIFGLVTMLLGVFLDRSVVRPLQQVEKVLERITNGETREIVDVRVSREFEHLSDGINATVRSLNESHEEINRRIRMEMEMAKNVQLSVLPMLPEQIPGVDLFAMTRPCREVGGDFYDFFLNRGQLTLLIADVSGKGVPAAMFMMSARAKLRTWLESERPLSEAVTLANRDICLDSENNDMFVTALIVRLDMATGRTEMVCAGHNPPVLEISGQMNLLRMRPGFVLGGMSGTRYRAEVLQLKAGDTLLLYTDGVTEALNASGEMYGEKRLLERMRTLQGSRKQAGEGLLADIDSFARGTEQTDDITMVALALGEDFGQTAPAP